MSLPPVDRRSFTLAALAAAVTSCRSQSAPAATGGGAVAGPVEAEGPSAISATAAKPRPLGIYPGRGGAEGRAVVPAFEAWIGRPVNFVMDNMESDKGWGDMLGTLQNTLIAYQGGPYELIVSLPMIVPGAGGDLAAGMNGDFDKIWTQAAQIMVAHGRPKGVIRLGWEFNLPGMSWFAGKDPAAFAGYWRRIVTVMRATAPGLRFDWCITRGDLGVNPELCWPGSAYVDCVGIDLYNERWNPSDEDPAARWRWVSYSGPFGMAWTANWAMLKGKRVSLPEWGTGVKMVGGADHGGGDDPLFVRNVVEVIDWLGPRLLYHNYWHANALESPSYDAALADGSKPKAAAAFKAAFGPADGPRA